MTKFDFKNKEITEYIVVVNMGDSRGDVIHRDTPTNDLDIANKIAFKSGNNFVSAYMRTITETYSELRMGLTMSP
jgi:hypothetical protein